VEWGLPVATAVSSCLKVGNRYAAVHSLPVKSSRCTVASLVLDVLSKWTPFGLSVRQLMLRLKNCELQVYQKG
jgi:hypothetical protein